MSYPKGTNFNRDRKEFKILKSCISLNYDRFARSPYYPMISDCYNIERKWRLIKKELYPKNEDYVNLGITWKDTKD